MTIDTKTASKEELINYISYLTGILQGAPRLIQELNLVLSEMANELEAHRTSNGMEETKTGKFLTNDKDDKLFERVMTLLKSQDVIKSASIVTVKDDDGHKPKKNIQDYTMNSKS